jgi:hypothetical protein
MYAAVHEVDGKAGHRMGPLMHTDGPRWRYHPGAKFGASFGAAELEHLQRAVRTLDEQGHLRSEDGLEEAPGDEVAPQKLEVTLDRREGATSSGFSVEVDLHRDVVVSAFDIGD